jgi:hypothetical protein
MSYFVPASTGFNAALKVRTSERYYKLLIDTNADGNLEDVTSQIYFNDLGGGFQNGSSNEWKTVLNNVGGTYQEGDLAGAKCRIDAKCGVANEYVTIFTGYVDRIGVVRNLTIPNDDTVIIKMVDYTKYVGTNRKTGNYTLINFKVCDPSATGSSLFHKLALDMGLTAGQLDVSATVPLTKDYIGLSNKDGAYKEIQSLSDSFMGTVYHRYDGKLRLITPYATGWSEPTSEYKFGDSVDSDMCIHSIEGGRSSVICNHVSAEFDSYQASTERVVHKNVLLWNAANNYNEIQVAAGEYWPGETVEGKKATLEYKDPKTGVSWDMCINIPTPTIGAYGESTAYDIECANGLLTLHSFNGTAGTDSSLTEREAKAAQIILKNNTAGTVTIRKFEIRGTPVRIISKNQVKDFDATVPEYERIPKVINGRYATDINQIYKTCKWWNTYGKEKRQKFTIVTDWLPTIQKGAKISIDLTSTAYPDAGIDQDFMVDEFEHLSPAGSSMTNAYTRLILSEYLAFDNTGTSPNEKQDFIAVPAPEEIEQTLDGYPTHTELQTGYNLGGGTTTPTKVTITKIKGIFKGVNLFWDEQKNLTNFDYYQIQVSSNNSDWYSLRFDGVDWKDTLDEYTQVYAPTITHTDIPLGGTSSDPAGVLLYYRVRRVTKSAVEGTFSDSASTTTKTVSLGELAKNIIYANNMIASEIATMFLFAGEAVIVGYAGTGDNASPDEGDRRTVIEDDEMRQEEYTAGAWSTVKGIKIGGALTGLFLAMIGCHGLYHPELPPTSNEFFPNNNFLVYNFDADSYVNQYGADDWNAKANQGTSTTQKKFGARSFLASADTATLTKSTGGTVGGSQSCGQWHYIDKLAAGDLLSGLQFAHASNLITLNLSSSDGVARISLSVTKNSSVIYAMTKVCDVSMDVWIFIAMSYKASTDTLSVIVNGTIYTYASLGGSWGSGTLVFSCTSMNTANTVIYTDEVCIAPDQYVNPDIWVQHYNHGVAWNTSFSAADLILACNTGGRVRFDTKQAEESCGTLHMIPEASRPGDEILNGGTSSTFADVDFSAYTPYGVRVLLLRVIIEFNGNGTADLGALFIRKNGSTETDVQKLCYYLVGHENLTNAYEEYSSFDVLVECDLNGVIEYKVDAQIKASMNIKGYVI